jgi:hypothetical protein
MEMRTTTPATVLRRRIMRRVWYSFCMSLAVHPGLWQGMAFAIALALFRELVFVARVVENLLATPLGQLPQFAEAVLRGAVANGEFITLMSLGALVMISLSMGWRVLTIFRAPKLAPTLAAV